MAATKQPQQFKIILSDPSGGVRGRPYRTIAVAAGASLYDLAEAVIEAFDFDLDHAFGFYDNIKNWTRSDEGYESFSDMGERGKFPGVEKVKISKVFRTPKQKMLLLFDYGVEWHFIVQYAGDAKVNQGQNLPLIVESIGKAPVQYDSFGMDHEDDFYDEYDEDELEQDGADAESDVQEESEHDRRIEMEAIINNVDPKLLPKIWYHYLNDFIYRPFKAECDRILTKSPLRRGDEVTVLQMLPESECTDDMWVLIEWNERQFAVPLVQLQPIEPIPRIKLAVEQWRFWKDHGYRILQP